jgi:hypothetical protein
LVWSKTYFAPIFFTTPGFVAFTLCAAWRVCFTAEGVAFFTPASGSAADWGAAVAAGLLACGADVSVEAVCAIAGRASPAASEATRAMLRKYFMVGKSSTCRLDRRTQDNFGFARGASLSKKRRRRGGV